MLGIHGVRRGGADYYLADLAPELPVSHLQRWAGTAAHAMGLDGPLDPDSFRQLLDGRHPRTGQPIGSTRVQVTAFDLTFSAPKSVSVLFALGGPDTARQVVARHADAVAGALSYLEVHGVTARRRSGEDRVVLPTSGAAAGLFTHGVNRNGDPHVHAHVVMANLVHGVDGRWSACDWRGLDAHRRAASAVYEAHLRTALTDTLGVRWTNSSGRPEIAGLAPALPRRVLVPGGRHPPPAARGRRPLGPGRSHQLGVDAAGQGDGRPLSGPGEGVGPTGFGHRATRPELGPREGDGVAAPSGRAPLRRRDLGDAPRRGPPARRRGGARRRSPHRCHGGRAGTPGGGVGAPGGSGRRRGGRTGAPAPRSSGRAITSCGRSARAPSTPATTRSG